MFCKLDVRRKSIVTVAVVWNLGVYVDAEVTKRAHVTATVRACFAILRQISSIRHSLSRPALLTLLRALVISKLDYCSTDYALYKFTFVIIIIIIN